MADTQDNRCIAIATPLGKDKLLLKSCTITEQLGRPFVIKAQLLSAEPAVDFLALLGKGVTIRWTMPDPEAGEKKRYFSGYISSFLQRPRGDGYYNYEATIVPWLWFLTRTADCRIFHKAMKPEAPETMDVPGIIKKVFKDHGFDDVTSDLTKTDYRKLDHCVQYRETDFNFVSRLMERDGIYYFFEHVDEGGTIKHKLKLIDAMSKHAKYPGYETIKYLADAKVEDPKGSVISWTRVKQVQPGAFKVNDFDFKRPKTNLLSAGTKERQHANAAFEIYDGVATLVDEEPGDHGDFFAKVRIDELQAQHDVIYGKADCPGMACGSLFTLEDHPRKDENGDYVIVGVTYQCTAEPYKAAASGQSTVKAKPFTCEFNAIPADATFRPTRITEKPCIHGPQTAIVVGKSGDEINSDEFGRIKVHFHWDRYSEANQDNPCWLRVSQSWAGKNWGSVFLPRIGQEVIVEFLDGDPDRPIVTGCVYNGESKPPYPLPDNQTMSTIKSNSSKGGKGFNEFRFEDKKGDEMIFTHAEKDHDTRVKHDTKEWIGNDRHLIVKTNQTELVEKDKHAETKGDQLLKVGGDLGTNITGNQITKVGGNLHAGVTGDLHLKATGDARVAGANVDLKAGTNGAFEAGSAIHIKAATIVIEATTQLSLKVGGNFLDIASAALSIVGTMVNINSGGAAGSGSGAQAASPESPDAPAAAKEASKAEPGSSDTAITKPAPPELKKFSPSALALQEAARDGTAAVEE